MRSASFAGFGLVALLVAAICGSALAANGYLSQGTGMRAKAVGGASAAWPQDALSGADNPAAPAFLGNRFDFGLDIYRPSRSSMIAGNEGGDAADGTYDANGDKNFFMPEVGYNNQYREHLAVGFALYSGARMNTAYATPIPLFGTTNAGLDLAQVFLVPYVAYRVRDDHSIGFGINLAWQSLEVNGLQEFTLVDVIVEGEDTTYVPRYSIDPDNLTDRGHESSMGVGVTVGYMGRIHEMVDVGLVYQSRTYMGRFKKYQGLLAEMGDFDLPPSLSGGITVRPSEKATVAFDVQHVWYGNIKSLNNPLLPNFAEAMLGDDDGPGFGWSDVTAFKFGVAYDATDRVRLLGGYNYGTQPIPETETLLNMLMPGVVEHHLTLGAVIKTCRLPEITLAYVHAFENEVKGSESIPASFGGGESNLVLSENSFGLAVGWSF